MTSRYSDEGGLSVKNILSIIVAVTGLLSFLLLLAHGLSYKTGYYPSDFNMADMIFGTVSWNPGLNPGLLSAFIIMAVAVVSAILMNFYGFFGFLSIISFLTSSVLWFCTVALYGNMSATLGTAGWCLGIFNFIDAALAFVGATYR